jgi:hypothetical protein
MLTTGTESTATLHAASLKALAEKTELFSSNVWRLATHHRTFAASTAA